MLAQDRLQGTVDQRRFAAPRHACHTDQRSQWKSHIYVFQVITAGSFDGDELAVSFPTFGRNGNFCFSVQISGRQRIDFQHLLRRTFVHDLSAQTAGFRTHVDHVIGIQHHILVMFHDNDRVPCITKFFQRVDQTDIITLMQPDTRLIQYI